MRIAVLTHVFPPSSHPNAKRPYYYARALQNAGCEVSIFTSRFSCTANFNSYGELFHIKRFPDTLSKLDAIIPPSLLYRCVFAGISGMSWPDIFSKWSYSALKAIHVSEKFDRIIAFVLPASISINAARFGTINSNWIFDYQESVTPFLQKHPSKSPLKRALSKRAAILEATALNKAGNVIFTSNTNRKAYVENRLVNAGKTIHIPYFYLREDFPGNPVPLDQNSFCIAYFGNFDAHGHRNPKAFLKSLAIFLKNHPEAVSSTKFVFYGTWRSENNPLIGEFPFTHVIVCNPPCPYSEYLTLLQQQTALLLVVAPEHNLFMPSKVVDYFGAQRPVLGFAPRDSEMWRCLESAGMGEWLVDYHDAAAGAAAIERLWKAHIAGTLHVEPEKLKQWSSEIQIPRILKAVLGEN